MNKKIVLLTLFIVLVFISNAQPGGGGLPGGGGSPPCWPPPCIPIDGGISIFTFLMRKSCLRIVGKNCYPDRNAICYCKEYNSRNFGEC